jgi:uncharacterized membrane protein
MRAALFHPMIVHFPLALLLTGSALRFAHFFFRKNRLQQALLFSSWILLSLGVISAWFAVVAGEIAEDIVRTSLCKPSVLDQHKMFAYTTAILFSVAIVLDLGKAWIKKASFTYFSIVFVPILYFAGVLLLIFTGGFGGDLVYDQGAAVENICE